jgi:hypothetical protein
LTLRTIDAPVRPPRRRLATRAADVQPRPWFGGPGRLVRARDALAHRAERDGRTAAFVTVLVATGALLQATRDVAAAPRGGDEGAQVAAAWVVGHPVPAGAETFSAVRPSLAAGHLAAWDALTGAFARAPDAVAAGRELMVVALVVTALLVWVLARRMGLARWSAAPAAALVVFSPLAVDLHRTVQPANLAVPWLLGALVLTRARHQRLVAAWLAAGVFMAVAVLTEPLLVVAVPATGWQLWRTVRPSARVRALATAGGAFAAAVVPGWALVLDGRLRVTGVGDLADLGERAGRSAADLLALDPLGAVVCAVAAVVAPLAVPRLRPVAAAFWPLLVLAVRAEGVAPAALACALPLGAVLLGSAVEVLWAWTASARRTHRGAAARPSRLVSVVDAAAPLAMLGLAVVAAVAFPRWATSHADLAARDRDAPLRDAQAWVAANVPRDQRLIVDDAIWVDLVDAGFDPAALAGYGRVGSAWPGYDYIVATGPATSGRGADDPVARAVVDSQQVAVFGSGPARVEVRRVGRPDATAGLDATVGLDAAGAALATNPALDIAPAAADLLRRGGVDERLLTMLATLALDHRVAVAAFPLPRAERDAGGAARTVDVAALDDRPVSGVEPVFTEVMTFLDNQPPSYRPSSVEIVAGDRGRPLLRITFPVA